MATLSDVTSQDWSLSLTPGEIVQGMDDIQQCIYIILTTQKGTDPTRPDFGCGIFEYIDRPLSIAAPNMKKEIIFAIATYEPRAQITQITHTVEYSKLTFNIEWTISGSSPIQSQTTVITYG